MTKTDEFAMTNSKNEPALVRQRDLMKPMLFALTFSRPQFFFFNYAFLKKLSPNLDLFGNVI